MDKLNGSNKFEHVSMKSRKRILFDNFLGGLSWGVGTVIGATIIVGALGILVYRSENIPLVGEVIRIIEQEVRESRNNQSLIPISEGYVSYPN